MYSKRTVSIIILVTMWITLFGSQWIIKPNLKIVNIYLNADGVNIDREWSSISVDGSDGYIYNYGSPKIPVFRKVYYVPRGSSIEAKIINKKLLKEIDTKNEVEPLLRSAEKIEGARVRFEYNKEAYSNLYPENDILIEHKGVVRGMDVFEITVMPIKYQDKKIYVYEYDVDIRKTLVPMNSRLRSKDFSVFSGFLGNEYKANIVKPPKILFITPTYYLDSLYRYAGWKYEMGYDVVIATEDSISPWSNENIKQYIKNAYDNWENPPTYVILVGDVDDVPTDTVTVSGSTFNTDQTYGMVDGDSTDYYPDIYIGRFSVSSPEELSAVITKMLNVEQGVFNDGYWTQRAQFIGSSDGTYWSVSEGTHNYVIDTLSLDNNYGFSSYKTYPHTYGADEQDIAERINRGVLYNVYSGHGSAAGYSDGNTYFDKDSVNYLLHNEDMYPFNVTHACLTHDFDTTLVSGGEAWFRKQNGGAFTSWGATTNTLWVEDDTLERAWFRACFYDSIWTIGAFTQIGLHAVDNSGSDRAEYYFCEYNILGDPSIMIRSGKLDTLNVVLPDFYNYPSGDLEIKVTDNDGVTPIVNAWVSVYLLNGTIHKSAYTDSNGIAVISYDNANDPDDTMYVVVTAHNYRFFKGGLEAQKGAPLRPKILNPIEDAWVNPSDVTLRFYTTDDEGDSVAYRILWSVNTDNFANSDTEYVPGLYGSGDTIIYSPYLSYDDAFVYYKVQAIDPKGDSLWSSRSYTRVLRTNSKLANMGWYQSLDNQFRKATLYGVHVSNNSIVTNDPTKCDTNFVTSFENESEYIVRNISGDTTMWTRIDSAYDGKSAMAMRYSLDDEDDWLIINKKIAIDKGDSLLFAQKGKWTDWIIYHGLWYSEKDTSIASFKELNGNLPKPKEGEWGMSSVDISELAGKSVYLAFRYKGQNADNWYIDDINITVPLPPDTGIALSNVVNASDFLKRPDNYGQILLRKGNIEDSIALYLEGWDDSTGWHEIKGPIFSNTILLHLDASDVSTDNYESVRLKAIVYPYEDDKYPFIQSWGIDLSNTLFSDSRQTEPSIQEISKPYPNPSKGVIYFRVKSSVNTDLTVSFFDISGRKVYEKKYRIYKGGGIIPVKLSSTTNVNRGIYFYRAKIGSVEEKKGKIIIIN